jgi:DNA polymerase-3 subunit beta
MSEFTLVGTPSSEFPELPSITGERNLSLEQRILKSMIRQTIYAVATSENKPVHTGCLFEAGGEEIRVVAVDGYRLAIRREKLAAPITEECSFVVPGKTLSEISHILGDSEEKVEIELSRKHILFRMENTTVVSRLLEGEFLNYANALPKESRFIMEVPVRPFTDCVERASLLINERAKAPIRLNFGFDSVKVSCATAIGKVQDEFAVKGEGTPLEMGFNNRYLLDALKACEQEKVKIELGTQLTPMVIKPVEGDGFLFLVLPVRIKHEN